MSYTPRLGRVVGLSANKECQVQSPKVGQGRSTREGGGGGGSSWILATLSINATYRDLCTPMEKRANEKRREVEEGYEREQKG